MPKSSHTEHHLIGPHYIRSDKEGTMYLMTKHPDNPSSYKSPAEVIELDYSPYGQPASYDPDRSPAGIIELDYKPGAYYEDHKAPGVFERIKPRKKTIALLAAAAFALVSASEFSNDSHQPTKTPKISQNPIQKR